MDEYLKTLRFSHRLILIYAGTILLISLSPNPVFRYEQAREELIALQKFDYERFIAASIDEWDLVALADHPSCADSEPYASDRRIVFDSLTQSRLCLKTLFLADIPS